MITYRWTSNSYTDPGRVREANEDARLERPEIGLWVVADGMGGHSAGDVASRSIVERLSQVGEPASLSEFVTTVELALLEVNARLRDLGNQAVRKTIGSTVVALLLHGRHAMCLWAGDSRIYRFRDGRLVQLTQDHAFVEDLVVRGYLNREDAAVHPQANLVTRAIGAADDLRLDLEITELADGDLFLLCSDGLDKELADEEIARFLAGPGSGRQAGNGEAPSSADLVNRVLERGARDNVTVVLVRVRAEHEHP